MIINEDFYDENAVDEYILNNKQILDEFYELTESEGIIHDFDEIFDELLTDIETIICDKFITNEFIDFKNIGKGYNINSDFCYKSVYNSTTHKKDIDVSYYDKHENDSDWYRICYHVHNSTNGKERLGIYISHAKHIIYITINYIPVSLMTEKELKEALLHELTHIARFTPDLKYDFTNMNIYNIDKIAKVLGVRQVVATYTKDVCYILSKDELNAFLSQTHQHILNYDDKTVKEIKEYSDNQIILTDYLIDEKVSKISRFSVIKQSIKFAKAANYNNKDDKDALLFLSCNCGLKSARSL